MGNKISSRTAGRDDFWASPMCLCRILGGAAYTIHGCDNFLDDIIRAELDELFSGETTETVL